MQMQKAKHGTKWYFALRKHLITTKPGKCGTQDGEEDEKEDYNSHE
jgi:hypothetical protein